MNNDASNNDTSTNGASNNDKYNNDKYNNDKSNNDINSQKMKMKLKMNNSNNSPNDQSTVKGSNTKGDKNEEAFEIKRKKTKNGFDVDYASTVEDAYDELNKIIGGDGVKKLTSDTQNLMQQQLQLAEAMKGMQPLIEGIAPLMEQAKGLIGGGGLGGLGGGVSGMEGIANLAKQFTK